MDWHTIYTYLTSLNHDNFYAVAGFIGSGLSISVLLEVFKPAIKKFTATYSNDIYEVKRFTERVIIGLLGMLSFAISVATNYMNGDYFNLSTVAGHATWIMTLAVTIYHFGASKQYANIRKWLTAVNAYLDKGTLPDGTPKS